MENTPADIPVQPETPTVPAPVFSSSNFPLILVGLIAVLIVGLGGIHLGRTYFAPKPSDIASLPPRTIPTLVPTSAPTPTSDPTTDWKTYTNSKYSFSFKHPDFDEKCCGLAGAVSDNPAAVITLADISTVIPNTDAPFDGLSVYIIPNENNLTLDQYIEKEKTALFEQFKVMADPNMTRKGQVVRTKIANQPAISLVDYSWDGITRTYFKHPNSKVIIEISKKEQSLNHFSSYGQILSTFRFTD